MQLATFTGYSSTLLPSTIFMANISCKYNVLIIESKGFKDGTIFSSKKVNISIKKQKHTYNW